MKNKKLGIFHSPLNLENASRRNILLSSGALIASAIPFSARAVVSTIPAGELVYNKEKSEHISGDTRTVSVLQVYLTKTDYRTVTNTYRLEVVYKKTYLGAFTYYWETKASTYTKVSHAAFNKYSKNLYVEAAIDTSRKIILTTDLDANGENCRRSLAGRNGAGLLAKFFGDDVIFSDIETKTAVTWFTGAVPDWVINQFYFARPETINGHEFPIGWYVVAAFKRPGHNGYYRTSLIKTSDSVNLMKAVSAHVLSVKTLMATGVATPVLTGMALTYLAYQWYAHGAKKMADATIGPILTLGATTVGVVTARMAVTAAHGNLWAEFYGAMEGTPYEVANLIDCIV